MVSIEYQARLLEESINYIRSGGDIPKYNGLDAEVSSWLNTRIFGELGAPSSFLGDEVNERYRHVRTELSDRVKLAPSDLVGSQEVRAVLQAEKDRGRTSGKGSRSRVDGR